MKTNIVKRNVNCPGFQNTFYKISLMFVGKDNNYDRGLQNLEEICNEKS